MNFKSIFSFFIIYVTGTCCFAQGKKEIVKNKIKSITENVTLNENGKQVTYKESYIFYNNSGKVLEETNFNKDGSIRKKATYKYDTKKNKTEETIFNKKEAEDNQKDVVVNKKTTFKYNANDDKTEEVEYDGNNKVIKKTAYTYNSMGEKITETYYDGEEKIKKKINYTYNAKGLKIKRETFGADNTPESIKTYTYEFY